LRLLRDTGTIDDGRTMDPTITARLANDGPVDNLMVKIDYKGDSEADDYVFAAPRSKVLTTPWQQQPFV